MKSTPAWVAVVVLLPALVNGARNEVDAQPCATVLASGSVVPLGSPVTATCVIRDDCPLVAGQAVRIEWRLGDRILPGGPADAEGGRVSRVVIPSFNLTREFLTCCVQASPAQVVAGVEIRAGYPPEAPQNLSCTTNLTNPNTLTCSWDAGQQETHLHTKYTLHTQIWDSNENNTYEPPPGVHRYSIPRSGFVLFSDIRISVKAVNELGEATSAPLVLEPVSAAKFDPPTIVRIQTKKYGCLQLSWNLSQQQAWMVNWRLDLEVRRRLAVQAVSGQWSEQPILLNGVKTTRSVDLCRLLHGTRYLAQIRVRYQGGPWSEWSSSRSGVTLENAPSGRLDWWMKASWEGMEKQLNILLFWKPSKQFRANGQNVSYAVSGKKLAGANGKVCSTTGNYCSFHLPRGVKKVYLSAVNAVGKSSPTEVRIHPPRAREVVSNVTVVPQDDRSLLVRWRSQLSSGLTGFVVEWRPLLQTDLSFTQFEFTAQNQTQLLIAGSFEPYKPYGISVYPRFKDGIGFPQTVDAYSREKAPSMAPKIQIKKVWKSHVELAWDEIPLEQRNGCIQNYTVFYCDPKGNFQVVNADPKERRVVLNGLNSESLYEAFLMVSTLGGSLNGSTVHFKVENFDAAAVVEIVTVSLVGLLLAGIIVVGTCFSNKRLKGHFWPAVPDPANSSIKRWTSESTQDSNVAFDNEEPNPMYLSHLSFLDVPVKPRKKDDDPWLSNAEDTSDLGESICGSPLPTDYSGSNSDSVPYATVVFSGPRNSTTPEDPHVYLRSESTQPLLETEESFSPKCYHNMATAGMPSEQCFFGPSPDCVPETGEGGGELWDDFPFLRALALNDTEND
uniref:Colony stimulating factor 3 receptor n=1 Tax=Gasterosteus aculeatus aculeatus TaxID=481459 RepID=A0AAQ4PI38_GASAC|nr:granulocyte colony-stimulating factor receptor [Gasterosteus aculeatus aculeatus]XP_040020392.1 granulocyte colony-stimulating factor receptor [Gasterosteus aculeatus aculeatus]